MTDSARTRKLQTQANELLRQLDRKVFGGAIDIAKLPEAVGMVEDFAREIRQQTAKEIADWMDYANETVWLPADKYKCVKKLAESIREKYEEAKCQNE